MDIKHVLNTKQFLNEDLLVDIFKKADTFEKQDRENSVPKVLDGKVLACIFYEPSTRTRLSFESAMLKLGGGVISTESAGYFSSAIKGETLEDSIKVIADYSDAIVLRHPEIKSAERAAQVSSVPIINAGDGGEEHPTQALLDLYTIRKEIGRTDNIKVALVGDLLHGRTIHSLVYLLAMKENVEIFFVSPKELEIPESYKEFLKSKNIKFSEFSDLSQVVSQADILYMTRIQQERFSDKKIYEKVKDCFVLTKDMLSELKKEARIMHPLPRVKEIGPEIDKDERAAYFRQARNGLYLRMALLSFLLE